jgi:hypothetical protein
LRYVFVTIVQRFRSASAAIPQRFRNNVETIAQQLRYVLVTIVQRFRSKH